MPAPREWSNSRPPLLFINILYYLLFVSDSYLYANKKMKCILGPWDSHIRTRTPYCYHLRPRDSLQTLEPHATPNCTLGPHDTPTCTLGRHYSYLHTGTPLHPPAHWDPITPTCTLGPHYSYLHTGTPLILHAHWDPIIPTCTLGPITPTRTLGPH